MNLVPSYPQNEAKNRCIEAVIPSAPKFDNSTILSWVNDQRIDDTLHSVMNKNYSG